MKKYLIVLFCALFGLAQIAQAANPDDVKKGKQKAQQSVHKAPQTARKAPQHVGKAPTAVKKSSTAPVSVSSHQGNAQFKKNQATVSTHNNTNLHAQKSVNRQTATVHSNTNLHVKKPSNANNAAVAAQSAKNKQHIAQAAAQPNWQHKNKVNQNNVHIAAQRNWQNQNNGTPINGQTTWNRTRRSNSSSLSFDEASRRWHRGHHHRDWWRSHYGTNIVLFGRGYYYWDSGYWYPAYGYDPVYSSYEYDGPIYGYNNLPPGQVVTNVQSALQQQGYYRGEIDGSIGPLTRAALRRYQRDNGLEITAAIDEPTLASLGMV